MSKGPFNDEEAPIMFLDSLEMRVEKLQSDWAYYTKPRLILVEFTEEAHKYYKSIPTRLDEIEEIFKIIRNEK